MTRLRAFAIHLIAKSAGIILALLGLMHWVWYPAPYFEINGGWHVWRILAGVDVVLGPLLTLIVFKSGKPSLKFDSELYCSSCKLAALIYGWNNYLSTAPGICGVWNRPLYYGHCGRRRI